jgi:hypothetical protein
MPHTSAKLTILISYPPSAIIKITVEASVQARGLLFLFFGPDPRPKKKDFCPEGQKSLALAHRGRSSCGGLHHLLTEKHIGDFLPGCQAKFSEFFLK